MYSQDAAHLFPAEEDDESITLDPEERKAVRKRLEEATELERENRDLREKLRRAQDELRRIKASAPFLAASDLTAEAGGVPSSRVFSMGGLSALESLEPRAARKATMGTPASAPSPTRPDSRWSAAPIAAPLWGNPSRSVAERSSTSLRPSRSSSR